ncbi:MAG: cellulase family glycosylhydrolase [Acholeplasmataceae bacterium]
MATIRGVNLGGWFVLESWIKPELFKGTKDCFDETCFMQQQKEAKQKLFKHYETFITEDDFIYLNSIGVKDVRLPLPWWFVGTDLYLSCRSYVHQAFKWAKNHHINILVDLHTAPGCQNGFDNGGIKGVMEWHKDKKNIKLTIESLEKIVNEFHLYESFYGIEVLNEPFVSIDLDIILDFYERAYKSIRAITSKPIVFHDAFRPIDEKFKTFFKDKENVMFDLHLYHCFDDKLDNEPLEKHIDLILEKRLPMIKSISEYVKVIIGEWSLGLREQAYIDQFNEMLVTRALADVQLYAYEHAFGYYFWNYKIERESHLNWDFKRLIKSGIMPNRYDLDIK